MSVYECVRVCMRYGVCCLWVYECAGLYVYEYAGLYVYEYACGVWPVICIGVLLVFLLYCLWLTLTLSLSHT
jgi:hypothetical protein